jgi:selenocysteine lyase/cysteine desulfurase
MAIEGRTKGAETARAELRSSPPIRSEFPGLLDQIVALDGAAGTLMPGDVIDAVTEALTFSMANVGGAFRASARSGATLLLPAAQSRTWSAGRRMASCLVRT